MTSNKNHPARSHAFLSRLHDGDLQPAERAHFDAHRAHCAECRTAAAEYERALSLFRSARSSPPPADMANRVLRKVQSVGRPRRPPVVSVFSIDWRWAGAFAAVLLVLLVGTPIALRQQSKATRAEGPITIAMQDREGAPAAGTISKQLAPPADASGRGAADSAYSPDIAAQDSGRAQVAPEPKAEAVAAAAAAPASRAPAPAQAKERGGGEGAREPMLISGDTPVLDRPSRLVVQPLDAQGSAPELDARPEEPDLTELRGRSFVLLVDASGRVRDVRETAAKTAPAADGKRRDAALAKEKDNAADPLKRLRFKPGERSRRLLVRVE
jgi:anti-sigma factor RsiW